MLDFDWGGNRQFYAQNDYSPQHAHHHSFEKSTVFLNVINERLIQLIIMLNMNTHNGFIQSRN